MDGDTFHAGERAVQSRLGVRERLAEVGPRVIRDYMPAQHREFFTLLPFLIVGSVDDAGQPWASVLAAPTGFIESPDPEHLTVHAQPFEFDPLRRNLRVGAAVGLLGMQPQTRRRNRMNGSVDALDATGFSIAVEQSFGNCPKYIQAREPEFIDRQTIAPAAVYSEGLDAAATALIKNADTFFIATSSASLPLSEPRGVDVSHRGGRPGFVHVDRDPAHGDVIVAPDYVGNFFFNTLGNLQLEPRAGLLFVDFDSGDLLYLAVVAEVIWEGAALAEFPGAQRLLRMRVQRQIHVANALPLRWSAAELSPFAP